MRAPLTVPRRALGVAPLFGKLYAVGGEVPYSYLYNISSKAVEAYDPAVGNWTLAGSLSVPNAYLAVASDELYSVSYAVGGYPNRNALQTSDDGSVYLITGTLPTPRSGLAASAINGVLYAIGGRDASLNVVRTVEAYDIRTKTWTTKNPMPTARYYLATAVIGNVIYAIGGTTGFSAVVTVEAYDTVTDTWTTKAFMPTARESLAVASLNGTLYAIGGENILGISSTVEAFTP
ncbi:MAG: hypothetical protein NVS2B17_13390 [Candidatus Velthaea sp.]